MFKILIIILILGWIIDSGRHHHARRGLRALKNRDNSGGGAGGFG